MQRYILKDVDWIQGIWESNCEIPMATTDSEKQVSAQQKAKMYGNNGGHWTSEFCEAKN